MDEKGQRAVGFSIPGTILRALCSTLPPFVRGKVPGWASLGGQNLLLQMYSVRKDFRHHILAKLPSETSRVWSREHRERTSESSTTACPESAPAKGGERNV